MLSSHNTNAPGLHLRPKLCHYSMFGSFLLERGGRGSNENGRQFPFISDIELCTQSLNNACDVPVKTPVDLGMCARSLPATSLVPISPLVSRNSCTGWVPGSWLLDAKCSKNRFMCPKIFQYWNFVTQRVQEFLLTQGVNAWDKYWVIHKGSDNFSLTML